MTAQTQLYTRKCNSREWQPENRKELKTKTSQFCSKISQLPLDLHWGGMLLAFPCKGPPTQYLTHQLIQAALTKPWSAETINLVSLLEQTSLDDTTEIKLQW